MSEPGFRAWQVFCTVLSLSMFGLIAWAVIRLVNHYT